MQAPQLFDLSGRTALVTGGGRGLGRHIAVGMAEAGAEVFIASRKIEACRETAGAIVAAGGQAHAFQADVAKPEDIDRLVAEVLERTPRLDILVNNAARTWAAPVLEHPLEGWDRVFDLNVRGVFYLSQQVARQMAESGGGSIIHIGSISATRSAPDDREPVVSYAASKGALLSLTSDMAVKLADKNIRVNCIAPGPFMTDMMGRVTGDPEKLEAFNAGIPQQRSGGENDIKGVAVFLASDAAAFVTGHTLVVDGGLSCATGLRV
jgi:NAD(P)-dependent dehydrogenase (short-subunit alcohol dehydrogenase family)